MRATLLSVLLLTACGDIASEVSFATTIQWSALVECSAGQTAIGQNMRAILDIGGHEPCDLTVNPITLEATGQCERITIGIVRPLGLGYWYPDSDDALQALAYVVGWVDLKNVDNQDNIDVPLLGDGTSSVQIDTNAETEALPTEEECDTVVEVEARNLCSAQAWARDRLALEDFDIDNDDLSNLEEACANTLFE